MAPQHVVENLARKLDIALFALTWAVFLIFIILSAIAVRYTYSAVTPASGKLRVSTITIVVANVAYIVVFSVKNAPYLRKEVQLSNSRTLADRVALEVIRRLSIVVVATLCDALVAWRFHVVYQRKVWAKYAPAALVALTAATGIASAMMQGVVTAESSYGWGLNRNGHLGRTVDYNAVYRGYWALVTTWTWMIVITNMALTLLIVGKILWAARQADTAWSRTRAGRPPYRTISRAFIESAFLSWIDVVLWAGINFSSPVRADVSVIGTASDIAFFIMPPIMGISQCLIIIRLGRAKRAEQENGRVLAEAVVPASPPISTDKHPFTPIPSPLTPTAAAASSFISVTQDGTSETSTSATPLTRPTS